MFRTLIRPRPLACRLPTTALLRAPRASSSSSSCSTLPSSPSSSPSGVDLDGYPIHRPGSPAYQTLVEAARASLAETGCASFPGFFTPPATTRAAGEARAAAPRAFVTDATHNAYQLPGTDQALPDTHPRNVPMRTRVASTAYDELDGSQLHALYNFDPFVRFVGDVTSAAPRLYRLADPLGACSVNIFRPGWHHAWHFDESEYTTTLCLQQSSEGGQFEFTPPLRKSQADLVAGVVAKVLTERSGYNADTGEHEDEVDAGIPLPCISTASFEPGTLQIFAGRYSLHHVKRIPEHAVGDRLVAVLCFATEPGIVNSREVQEMFWGRSVAAGAAQEPR